jgi:prophage regulatory protein
MNNVGRPPKDRLLDLPAVLEIVPISRSGMYAEIQRQRFPAPVKVGKSSYWRLSELERWMASLQPAAGAGK